jgi:hypothetical protein
MKKESLESFLMKMVENNIKKYSPKRTDKQVSEMYLDWFYNYESTSKFSDAYDLGMSETENIIDRGRELNWNKK